jgi:hypothetical protein
MRLSIFAVLALFAAALLAAPTESSAEAPGMLVLASKQVIGPDRQPVAFAFHLKPNNPQDSGWVFWSGNEDQEFIDDNANTVVSPLDAFLKLDPSLSEILDRPVGTAWERDGPGKPWREVPGYLEDN